MDKKLESETIYELICKLAFFDIFEDFEKKKLSQLKSNVQRFEPSEMIIREGDFEEALYVVLKGTVQVIKFKPKKMIITKLSAGDMFGELSWAGKGYRMCSIVSITEVITLSMDLKKFDKADLTIKDKMKDMIIKNMIVRMEKMNDRLESLRYGLF